MRGEANHKQRLYDEHNMAVTTVASLHARPPDPHTHTPNSNCIKLADLTKAQNSKAEHMDGSS